ncbi:hypothetical protein NQZ68_029733 [Dissostichus eleginoides]|nr:hypothetical protein NQZ68_029733 [Dissostichus eleginoides]
MLLLACPTTTPASTPAPPHHHPSSTPAPPQLHPSFHPSSTPASPQLHPSSTPAPPQLRPQLHPSFHPSSTPAPPQLPPQLHPSFHPSFHPSSTPASTPAPPQLPPVEDLEAELLRDQLLSVSQERHEHAQEVTSLNRKLQDAQSTLEDLLKEREGPSSLQEENLKLRVQNQELQHKLSELQVRGLELHKLTLEQQNLKSRVRELQEDQNQNQDKAVREALRLHSQQSSSQISMKQDQYEKAVLSLQQRTDQLETKLKAVRLVLQEKVSELKEQLSKSSQLSAVLKDLYVENSQLMKALQVTEQRQKHAEKKNFQLEDKVSALTKLLRDIVPAALAT